MNKSQAIDYFWNSFSIPAYDENSVPDDATYPYITYTNSTGSLNDVLSLTASIWDRSNSWERVSLKADEIAKKVGEFGHYTLPLDNGYVWFTKGNPFTNRMGDQLDDRIKRIYINVQAEFLTPY